MPKESQQKQSEHSRKSSQKSSCLESEEQIGGLSTGDAKVEQSPNDHDANTSKDSQESGMGRHRIFQAPKEESSEEEMSIKKEQKLMRAAPPEIPSSSSDSPQQAKLQEAKAAPGHPGPTKKLYVGNLSWELNEKQFLKIFKKYGSIKSACLVINATTGKSKGFGFVEFNSSKSAIKAKKDMSCYILYGKQVRVEFCYEQED